MIRREITERRGKIDELDRSFDIEFWQAQTPAARADAVWELVIDAAKIKGIDVRQLRLRRSRDSKDQK